MCIQHIANPLRCVEQNSGERAQAKATARVVFETAGPPPACSKWRHQLDPGIMERIVGRSYLNAYLPVPTHHQVAGGTEMAFPIRFQVHSIGSHIHIQDGGVERYPHISDWRARAGIRHAHQEAIGTGTIWIDEESDRQFAIRCLCRRVKWRSVSSWRPGLL